MGGTAGAAQLLHSETDRCAMKSRISGQHSVLKWAKKVMLRIGSVLFLKMLMLCIYVLLLTNRLECLIHNP